MSSSPSSSSSSKPAGASAAAAAGAGREKPAAAVVTRDEYTALHDVVCDVSVVLGTGRMSVRQCLYLTPQTVVPLDQPAGSDLRVLVNGVAIATGEVVILDESTAVRLNHVLAPPNREGRA
jgi:flagellar motor switch protein FliN